VGHAKAEGDEVERSVTGSAALPVHHSDELVAVAEHVAVVKVDVDEVIFRERAECGPDAFDPLHDAARRGAVLPHRLMQAVAIGSLRQGQPDVARPGIPGIPTPSLEVVQAQDGRDEIVSDFISPPAPQSVLEERDTTVNREGRQISRCRIPGRSEPGDSVNHRREVSKVIGILTPLEHEPRPIWAAGIVGTDLTTRTTPLKREPQPMGFVDAVSRQPRPGRLTVATTMVAATTTAAPTASLTSLSENAGGSASGDANDVEERLKRVSVAHGSPSEWVA
jgi:hypothetical protein